MTGDRPAFEFLAIETGEEIHQIVGADFFQGQLALLDEGFKFLQIAPVSRDGIRRQAFFDPNMRQERGDGRS